MSIARDYTVTIDLDRDAATNLNVVAAESGMTPDELVTAMLLAHFARKPTFPATYIEEIKGAESALRQLAEIAGAEPDGGLEMARRLYRPAKQMADDSMRRVADAHMRYWSAQDA